MRVRIKFYAMNMQVARVMQNKSSDRGGGRDKTETCLTDSPQSMCVCRGFLIAIFPHDKDRDEAVKL